jgi:hypothetical protein
MVPSCLGAPPGTVCFEIEPGDSGGPSFWTDVSGVAGPAGERYVVALHMNTYNAAAVTWAEDLGPDSSPVGPWIRETLDPDGDGSLLGEPPFLLGFDADGDGIGASDPELPDNCPLYPNPIQLDWDCDGIGDECDNCPDDLNSDQANADGDAMGDACDLCPEDFDDGDDTDFDGVPDACDLCPSIVSTGRNCNADAEVATGAAPRGDECDPNPCPDTVAREASITDPLDSLWRFVGSNHFDVDALAGADNQGDGTMGHRFCRCDTANENTRATRVECELRAECVIPRNASRVTQLYDLPRDDRALTGWKPIETSGGYFNRHGTLTYGSHPACTSAGVPPASCLIDVREYTLSGASTFAGRECGVAPSGGFHCFPDIAGDTQWTWMIEHDVERFGLSSSARAALRGVLWSHVESRPETCIDCTLDRALSSNFWSGAVWEDHVREPGPTIDLIERFAAPHRACPTCEVGFPEPWLASPCLSNPTLCDPPELLARFGGEPGPTDIDLSSGFSAQAAAALTDNGVLWFSPVEPAPNVDDGLPFLVALREDGSSVDFVLTVDSAGVAQATELSAPLSGTPAPRVDFAATYWANGRRLFVVGGAPSDGPPHGEVWWYWLDQARWGRLVAFPEKPRRVLATTVDTVREVLYAVDYDTSDPNLRLLEVDLASGQSRVVGSFPRSTPLRPAGLASAPDGALYVVTSTTDETELWVVRLQVKVDGTLELLGEQSMAGHLSARPHATGRGVSFVRTLSDPLVEVTGVAVEALGPSQQNRLELIF